MQRIPTALAAALLATSAWAHAATPDTAAVEFYNQYTGHYFVTASAVEALGVDAGSAGPGWLRTGRSFQAWLSKAAAPADAQPVCRFYSRGANSHFYTASATECAQLQAMASAERAATGTVKGWAYEGTAFYIATPAAGGQCPAGTTQITRLYNNGFATGEGSNHRFVDNTALQQLMVDRHWFAEGAVFCAADNPATGTEASLPATATTFDALAGTWTGSARWSVETPSTETRATQQLSLTIGADGTLGGSGDGCTFAGQVIQGDGFRSFFLGTASASGCTDPAFDGDYSKVRLERFGSGTLMARLQRGDDSTGEASIEARLENADAPPAPAASFDSVAGDWAGTVAWVAEQHLATGNMIEPAEVNQALALSITSTGTVTGSGFGCVVNGTLQPAAGMDDHGGFTGEITLDGCDQALFDGTFTRVHLQRAGPSRLAVNLERSTQDAQGSTSVEIEGALQLGAGGTAPPPVAGAVVTGSWQGPAGFLAVQRTSDGAMQTLVTGQQPLSLTLANDGTLTGTGFGCTFSATLTLSADASAVTGGTVSASGCTQDVLDGDYSDVRFELDDEGRLEVRMERETQSSGAQTIVKIGARLAPAAP